MDHEKLFIETRRLALRAGQAILEIHGKDDFEVAAKQDNSPVTEADLAADRIISEGLRSAFPDVALVTEEQSDTHKASGGSFLIVDPLDGTKEFVKRRGDFTVNIAYVQGGKPIRGMVYAPAKGRLFYTDPEGQSWEETISHNIKLTGPRKKLEVSEADNSALRVVASKSHRDQATDDYISAYQVNELRSAGSSLKFCLLASGEADLYPRLGRTMEWDTAAGHAVLSGAGGEVLSFETHEPLTYGKADFANPFFIARTPSVRLDPPA